MENMHPKCHKSLYKLTLHSMVDNYNQLVNNHIVNVCVTSHNALLTVGYSHLSMY